MQTYWKFKLVHNHLSTNVYIYKNKHFQRFILPIGNYGILYLLNW